MSTDPPREDADATATAAGTGTRAHDGAPAGGNGATVTESEPSVADVIVPQGTRVGRYLIVDPVGAGGMGVVYRAYDPELDRRVAIKLIRPARSGSIGHARLLREAQALARLSHPSIVAIHDVGSHDGRVFLAMEFLDGQTLRQWLSSAPRSRRAILEVFIAAGEGLVAAHAAGLVHRDFKPTNVIVQGDGRVRILDFGVARLMDDVSTGSLEGDDVATDGGGAGPVSGPPGAPPGSTAAAPSSAMTSAATVSMNASALQTPLTETGSAVGTPAYMAPEQLRGQSTALVDQYAFCVSLHEAIYGRRPARSNEPPLPPPAQRVPRWLERVLARGLAPRPAQRFPSMAALVAELRRHTMGRRWWPWAAAAAIAATAVVATLLARGGSAAPVDRCQLDPAVVERVWGDQAHAAVERAFSASGAPGALATFVRVRGRFDDRVAAWQRMRKDACEDTWVRGEQSQELLDRRVRCLDRRLDELDALVDLFAAGTDAQMVRDAPKAALELGSLDDCADPDLLAAVVAPPATAEGRLRADQLEHRLDAARALRAAGKPRDALTQLRDLITAVEELGHPPLLGRALFERGILESETGAHADAVATLHRAGQAAAEAGDDLVVARAWIELVAIVGYRQGRHDAAAVLGPVARAALERVGSPPLLEARLENNLGVVQLGRGDYAGARAAFERTLALRQQVLAPDDLQLALAIENVAIALGMEGDFAGSSEAHERALAIKEQALGPDHLVVGMSLNNYGEVLRQKGDVGKALEVYRRALAIFEATFSAEHSYVTTVLDNIGMAQRQRRDLDDAILTYRRVLAIQERTPAVSKPDIARILANYGAVLLEQGHPDQARPNLERAMALRREAFPGDHPDIVESLLLRAALLRRERGCAAAIADLEQALAMATRAVGDQHPLVASASHGLGSCALEQRRAAAAIGWLERALAIRARVGVTASERADTELALAKALRAAGRDRSRSEILAASARQHYASAEGYEREARAAEAWLKSSP